MLRNKQEQITYWFQRLLEFESVSAIFDLKNLLMWNGRTLIGFTREEMIKEAIFTIQELEKQGYLNIINTKSEAEKLTADKYIFDNITFEFTKKFKEIKTRNLRKQKFDNFKKENEFWIIVLAAIVSIISLVIQIFK